MSASTALLEPPRFFTAEANRFAEQFRALQQTTGAIVPPRRAFAPSSMRTLLPYLALLELLAPETILVRLVGTAVINRGRVDMTGKNLLDFYPESQRDRARQHHLRMLEMPCGSTFLSREEFGPVTTFVEIVNYPLADDEGKARFILGIAVETNRRELMLRGDASMQISALVDQRYLDIGAGS
jgi:hypothetical protein